MEYFIHLKPNQRQSMLSQIALKDIQDIKCKLRRMAAGPEPINYSALPRNLALGVRDMPLSELKVGIHSNEAIGKSGSGS